MLNKIKMVEDNIIEGSLKYRDGKKWKQRWAVLNKLSPVADVLQLRLYRDSRDKARGSGTKGSLALTNPLALITGFTLDKESHTLALLCRELAVILAFDSRERLLQWNSKINFTLGQEQQFLVQLVHVPMKSRIAVGPSKLHVRDNRFCISAGMPPRVLAAWASCDVRRYGVIDGRFVWEGGARCGRGVGVHIALSDAPRDITRAFDLAARGALTSYSRRGSSYQGSSGTIQRDAAAWLREVGALDLAKFSDTSSICAMEPYHLFSPQGNFQSKSDLSSVGWMTPRRPSCAAHDSYITGGSSSSSGSLVGDEPTWWANTWASGQSSLWEVPQSSTFDNLYDSPRSFAQPPVPPMCKSIMSQNEYGHVMPRPPTQLSYSYCCARTCKPQGVPENPMDNYDYPRQHFPNYDTPKKFHVMADSSCTQNECYFTSGSYPGRADTCGKVLDWAGTLMCQKASLHHENVETVRVNGEGRMPVLDANTGTIVQPILPNKGNVSCNCSFLRTNERSDTQMKPFSSQKETTCPLTAIYAVIDKSKKTRKPRCASPPAIQGEKTPTNSSQYVNLLFNQEGAASIIEGCDPTCSKCGGHFCEELATPVIPDSKLIPVSKEGSESPAMSKKQDDYLIMGPGPLNNQHWSSYEGSTAESEQICFNNTSKQVQYRPGRSLSLARRIRSPSPSNRRSTSADSRLHERWDWSQTPDQTPGGTPASSPKTSPYKTLSKSSCHARGRPREKPSEDKLTSSEDRTDIIKLVEDVKSNEVPVLRRSSSVPGQKSGNRDSASSSDSGVCESPRPSDKILLTHCLHNSLPRGVRQKLSLANDFGIMQKRELTINTTGDGKSSSGNSDTSDYLDTLSLSSHSSSDHDRLTSRSFLNTLRPRSGKEYSRLDRIAIENKGLPVVGELPTCNTPAPK